MNALERTTHDFLMETIQKWTKDLSQMVFSFFVQTARLSQEYFVAEPRLPHAHIEGPWLEIHFFEPVKVEELTRLRFNDPRLSLIQEPDFDGFRFFTPQWDYQYSRYLFLEQIYRNLPMYQTPKIRCIGYSLGVLPVHFRFSLELLERRCNQCPLVCSGSPRLDSAFLAGGHIIVGCDHASVRDFCDMCKKPRSAPFKRREAQVFPLECAGSMANMNVCHLCFSFSSLAQNGVLNYGFPRFFILKNESNEKMKKI